MGYSCLYHKIYPQPYKNNFIPKQGKAFLKVKEIIVFLNCIISMAENIKIYHNSNPRLGFLLNEASIANVYVDEEGLRKLVNFINQQFLICSNQQTQCLIDGCIDLDNKFVTIFCIAIVLPIAKAILFNDFYYLFIEYLLVFAVSGGYLGKKILKSGQMKQKYRQAEQQLEQRFSEIQEQFNRRFDYLKMEYVRSYDQNQNDYLQIKVVKIPSPMLQLENRMKKQIKLMPIQE